MQTKPLDNKRRYLETGALFLVMSGFNYPRSAYSYHHFDDTIVFACKFENANVSLRQCLIKPRCGVLLSVVGVYRLRLELANS